MSATSANTITSVAVIGGGQMGLGIAQVFISNGFTTHLYDSNADARATAREKIYTRLQKQIKKHVLTPVTAGEALMRLRVQETLDNWLEGCGLVVEAVSEDAEIKSAVYRAVEEHLPPTALLATNTSSYPISQLAAALTHPERFVGLHFMNPAPLMSLVEVIAGKRTSDATITATSAIVKRIGKTAVYAKDTAGFVANRIVFPMLHEAMVAVGDGTATIADVDTAMTIGMHHPMGPLTLADFIGLDTCLNILEVLHNGIGDRFCPCPLLRAMVAAGYLGKKTQLGFYDYRTPTPTPHHHILTLID